MNKLKKIIFSISLVLLLLFSSLPLFALREVAPTAGADLTQTINQEKALQKQIVTEKKMLSQPRISKPLPKSLPLPTKNELAARTALGGVKIPAVEAFSGAVNNSGQEIPMTSEAKEARFKAFQAAGTGNSLINILAGIILVFLLIAGVVILFKKSYGRKEQGNAMIMAIVVIFVIFIIGTSVVFLSENETSKTVKSNKQNEALYIADGGVEKALWEINRTSGYAGESNIALGHGKYTITVATPAGRPDQREIISTGQRGSYQRKIKVLCERLPGGVTVNSALACGGNVNMGGNASIAGTTLTGVLVPVGCSVNTVGGATVTGTPATGNAPFPAFEDIFGLTLAQMQGFATTKYTNPGNNPACTGITWVDGDLKATSSDWHGTGILIVNGNFDMSGGDFTGVIYVVGTFKMTGNALIAGSILSQSMADVTGIFGTADIAYSAAAVDQANNVYPFKIITWQEVKN
ncbi:MAG: hypothetical protein HY920_00035 [Elusimicrobia bacterium]|nr:hypothetical protein [Elusimicrobiota bacterium]